MFVDDYIKQSITSSDTDYNIVYEGTLRDKTHDQMLLMFTEIIMLIAGYKDIKVEFNPIPSKNRKWYPYYKNTITISGNGRICEKVFDNITIKCISNF